MAAAIASRTASAPCPARAGPFFALGPVPWPGGALDQGADRGAVQPDDQIAFPVPGHGPVFRLGRPLADHDLGGDEALPPSPGPGPRDPQRPAGAQARGELAAQRPATLDVEGLVDRLMRDPHGIIIGEVGPQPVRDLLRAPRCRPAPVLAAAVPPADPADLRAFSAGPIGPPHRTRQAVLHVVPQRLVHGELGGLGAPGAPVGMPLGRRGPVLQAPAAGRGIAPQLPRDRRSRAAGPPGDLPHPAATRPQDRDLLPLGKGQVTPRYGGLGDRPHASSVTEPPGADRRRDAGLRCGILARQAAPDRRPEPLPLLPPRHGRPAGGPHRQPRRIQPTPLLLSHRNSSKSRCCDNRLNPPCTPRSEWWTSPSMLSCRRVQIAISSASRARSACK